jgi:hypothetical protein
LYGVKSGFVDYFYMLKISFNVEIIHLTEKALEFTIFMIESLQ